MPSAYTRGSICCRRLQDPNARVDLTVDVRLLVQLGDAQQVGSLLLAADPRLAPRQRRLEVELVTAVRQRVRVPECLAASA